MMTVNEQVEQTGIAPGTILGEKYRVDYMVGRGGMGAVYAVTHVDLGRKAAIKTLLPSFLKDPKVVARFRQEAQMAASIGHDNICEVIDIATTADGMVYLLMPLLEGSNFSEFIEKRTLTLEAIVDIIGQTLMGLEAAHREKIVHRDLKPDNIFVTKIGDRENFVKLLDFGISKILDQENVTKLTQTGTMIGTPYYMPPEQAKGDRDIDYRADVYAIGVILYETLTGVCPFDGTTYNQIMYKILSGQFVPPRKINPSIPQPVEQVILKALAYDKADRYGSAEAMRQQLDHALALSPRHAYAPSAVPDEATMAAMATVESEQGVTPERLVVPGPAQVGEMASSKDDAIAGSFHATPMETVSTAPLKRTSVKWGIAAFVILVLATVFYVLFLQEREDASPLIVPIAEPPVVLEVAPSTLPDNVVSPASIIEPDGVKEGTLLEPADTDKKEEKTVVKKKKKHSPNRRVEPLPAADSKSASAPTEPPQQHSPTTKEKPVKGRFGTKFTSDY